MENEHTDHRAHRLDQMGIRDKTVATPYGRKRSGFIDMTGQRFGDWEVVGLKYRYYSKYFWTIKNVVTGVEETTARNREWLLKRKKEAEATAQVQT